MSLSSRELILSRLKHHSTLVQESETVSDHHATQEKLDTRTSEQLTQEFTENALANRMDVIFSTESEWLDILKKVLHSKNITQLMLGNTIEYHTQAATLLSQSSDVEAHLFDDKIEALKSTLFNKVDAGLTLAQSAIADTGTLVLIPNSQQPRSLSLVPPIHIALVKEETIVSNLQHLVNNHPDWPRSEMPSNIVLVSSPSKTADIQQTLAYGAHGPKEVIVIILKRKT